MRFRDNPGCGDVAEADKNKIMHIALSIGAGTILMATDSLESMGQKLTFGNNFYICLSPNSGRSRSTLQWPFSRRKGRNANPGHVLG
jgi:PhnB protein